MKHKKASVQQLKNYTWNKKVIISLNLSSARSLLQENGFITLKAATVLHIFM